MIRTRSTFAVAAASLIAVAGAYSLSAIASQPQATPAPKPDRLAAVRAQLKDPSKPFVLLVKFSLKAEPDAEFAKLADAAAVGTRKEPGNIAYEFSASAGNPKQVILYERWKSIDDLKTHFETEHFKAFGAKINDFTAGAPELNVYLPVSADSAATTTKPASHDPKSATK